MERVTASRRKTGRRRRSSAKRSSMSTSTTPVHSYRHRGYHHPLTRYPGAAELVMSPMAALWMMGPPVTRDLSLDPVVRDLAVLDNYGHLRPPAAADLGRHSRSSISILSSDRTDPMFRGSD